METPSAIPGHNAVYALFGCFLALVGWVGLNSAGAILFAGCPSRSSSSDFDQYDPGGGGGGTDGYRAHPSPIRPGRMFPSAPTAGSVDL